MDDEQQEISCRGCGRDTTIPPDAYKDWAGLCPGCVIRTFVFPLVSDERLKGLMEAVISHAQTLDDMGDTEVHVVRVTVDSDESMKHVREGLLELLTKLVGNNTTRDALKGLIEKVEGMDRGEGVGKTKNPVVRNDPRTG